MSSPVGSSPDEDYHLTSIWCAQGERPGLCEAAPNPDERAVPKSIEVSRCYAFQEETSGTCQGQTVKTPGGPMNYTGRGNFGEFAGDYPPVFFATMSPLASADLEASVVTMRVLNALIFVVMTGAAFALATPALRRALVMGLAVTMIPLGVFIVPSVNPSSWAITSAATVLVSVVVHVTAPDRRRWVLSGLLAGLAVLLGAGARGDAALYAALAVGAGLVLTFRRDRGWLRRAVYPAVLALLAVMSFLGAGQAASAVGGSGPAPLSLGGAIKLLATVPALWVGALGSWGLGWLDTYLPALVWVTTCGLLAAVLVAGCRGAGRQRSLAISAAALAAWLIPAYIQYRTGASVGAFIQPRYILPLLVILALTVLVRTNGEEGLTITRGERWFAVVGLAVANALSLHVNMRRYITGVEVNRFNLDSEVEWWWTDGFPSPNLVWIVGVLAFAGALALLSRELRPQTAPEPARTVDATELEATAGAEAETGPR